MEKAHGDHFNQLLKGAAVWNAWRDKEGLIQPNLRWVNLSREDLTNANVSEVDLSGANLSRADLIWANLSEVDLSGANLSKTDLTSANLSGANLRRANFIGADISGANLSRADLKSADLSGANLKEANLSGADLRGANLSRADLNQANLSTANLTAANLVEADLTNADLTGCRVYGISVWEIKLSTDTKQQDLIITRENEPDITVDNIEIAQFIYLLLHNEKIRQVIETITSKAVLILGRFTPERKAVLDAVRVKLRRRNYLPVVFDFEKCSGQSTDETITLLARMARFVIADISDAKSVLQELRAIVPDIPSLAVQPVIVTTQDEPGMFDFFHRYPWVLKAHRYDNQEQLLLDLDYQVIRPAEAKVLELRGPRPG